MNTWIVETKGLKKYYKLGSHIVKALDGVDFRVKEQEFVAIIGKSGSGKSTLLHMVGGLDTPTEGEVYVAGKRLAGMTKEELTIFRRRKVGFIFQNYNLVPDLNVYENVVLPLELDGRRIDREFVDEILGILKLREKKEAPREEPKPEAIQAPEIPVMPEEGAAPAAAPVETEEVEVEVEEIEVEIDEDKEG